MYYDLNFGERIKCSENEKKHSVILLKEILSQCKKAKSSGFLVLGQETDSISNAFLRDGLKLISKGYDYNTIEKILDIKISVRNARGIHLLEMTMIKEGLLSILRADPPALTEEILFSFLGKAIYKEYKNKRDDDFTVYIDKLSAAEESARSECGFWLLKAEDNEISFLLKVIDIETLSILMKMETEAVLYRIYSNLSEEAGKLFRERLSILKTPDGKSINDAEEIFRSITQKISEAQPDLVKAV